MPTVRIANANLEWMNYWFTNDSDAIGWRPTLTQDGQTYQTADRAAGGRHDPGDRPGPLSASTCTTPMADISATR